GGHSGVRSGPRRGDEGGRVRLRRRIAPGPLRGDGRNGQPADRGGPETQGERLRTPGRRAAPRGGAKRFSTSPANPIRSRSGRAPRPRGLPEVLGGSGSDKERLTGPGWSMGRE